MFNILTLPKSNINDMTIKQFCSAITKIKQQTCKHVMFYNNNRLNEDEDELFNAYNNRDNYNHITILSISSSNMFEINWDDKENQLSKITKNDVNILNNCNLLLQICWNTNKTIKDAYEWLEKQKNVKENCFVKNINKLIEKQNGDKYGNSYSYSKIIDYCQNYLTIEYEQKKKCEELLLKSITDLWKKSKLDQVQNCRVALKTLKDCLDKHFEPTYIHSNNYFFACKNCQTAPIIKQEQCIVLGPQTLIIHLDRSSSSRQKDNNIISYPVDDSKHLLDLCDNDKYELFGVCKHGGTSSFGHYISVVKRLNTDEWYHISDQSVSSINNKNEIQDNGGQTAMVLLYHKYTK